MSKRGNVCEIEADCINKIQVFGDQDEVNINIPIEMVMQIFGYLDNIIDIRICMLLSKEFRDEIFRSPQIMRKIMINSDQCIQDSFLKFIADKGRFIRNLKFEFDTINEKNMRIILHQVPNLEELIFGNFYNQWNHNINSSSIEDGLEAADMSKLRKLLVESSGFGQLFRIIKNVTKLEYLNCELTHADSIENFTIFLVQQINLKELTMEFRNTDRNAKFPNRHISSEVKFQLKVLNLKHGYNDNPYFLTFLQTQAEKLEELKFLETPDENIFKIIFLMCKNLKKLSLKGSDAIIYSEFYPDYELESLRYLIDWNFTKIKLTSACARFPNLESIKCISFEHISGIFENICNLELKILEVDSFQNTKLPNLRKLFVMKFESSIDENILLKFIKNIPNIECFKSDNIEINFANMKIFNHLKEFKNIQSFEATFCEKQELASDEYSEVPDPHEYKISIDFEMKTVKSGKHLLREKILRENFHDFELIEQKNENIWSWKDRSFPN